MSATHKVVVWYSGSLVAWVTDCMCGRGGKRRETKEAATVDREGHFGERMG